MENEREDWKIDQTWDSGALHEDGADAAWYLGADTEGSILFTHPVTKIPPTWFSKGQMWL